MVRLTETRLYRDDEPDPETETAEIPWDRADLSPAEWLARTAAEAEEDE